MSGHAEQQLRLGFLSAIGGVDHGFVAGLLITNQMGRPLEFQCTAPVKPNHAQVILYGPTLVPFVLGELLGKTLFEKVSLKPHLVLTDRDEILELRQHVSVPVACLTSADVAAAAVSGTLRLGRQVVRFHPSHASDADQVKMAAGEIAGETDLAEPIERVRVALQETVAPGAAA